MKRIRLVSLAAVFALNQISTASAVAADASPPPFSAEQLEQIVAPVALYPDSLLAQIFMASTYPLEVVEAARWTKANANVEGDALADAMEKQDWDPSVKSLAAFPQVLTMMDEKLDWTQQLGDAFLAQQKDVMDAVQRLRTRAHAEGNLESSSEQKVIVETQPQTQTTVIKVEPANPQVVYVPAYNPTVVYGTWPYPAYPPYAYYPPGYVASSALWFGAGMVAGAALWGNCNWGYGDIDVNVNHYNNFNRTDISNTKWEHKAEHRKGVQYRDQATQGRYGREGQPGVNSREQFRGRAEQGRRDLARGGADEYRRDGGRQGPSGSDMGRDRPAAGSRDSRPADRAAQAPRRDASGADRWSSRGSSSDAFQGMGNAGQTRRESSRGYSSRQSAASRGYGGYGGGGYGGRRGGSFGGGGRGGGGRGGGRR